MCVCLCVSVCMCLCLCVCIHTCMYGWCVGVCVCVCVCVGKQRLVRETDRQRERQKDKTERQAGRQAPRRAGKQRLVRETDRQREKQRQQWERERVRHRHWGYLHQQKCLSWTQTKDRTLHLHLAVLGQMPATLSVAQHYGWAPFAFHCTSSTVWNTQLWSVSYCKQRTRHSDNDVKPLIHAWPRSQTFTGAVNIYYFVRKFLSAIYKFAFIHSNVPASTQSQPSQTLAWPGL